MVAGITTCKGGHSEADRCVATLLAEPIHRPILDPSVGRVVFTIYEGARARV
jgi:hypothetical protein